MRQVLNRTASALDTETDGHYPADLDIHEQIVDGIS